MDRIAGGERVRTVHENWDETQKLLLSLLIDYLVRGGVGYKTSNM